MSEIALSGAIPEPPVILCRDENAHIMVMHALHKDWARIPTVSILEEWPGEWDTVNAVVCTPIHVLGTEKAVSFEILGDEEITDDERTVLNAYLTIMRTGTSIGRARYRDLVVATGFDRRKVGKCARSLAEKGIGTYKYGDGYKLDIGKFVVDPAKAKALGINIKEYDR